MNELPQKTLNDILETVEFIKDHAATKDELLSVEERLKEHLETRLTETKTEIMTHVDSFIALH